MTQASWQFLGGRPRDGNRFVNCLGELITRGVGLNEERLCSVVFCELGQFWKVDTGQEDHGHLWMVRTVNQLDEESKARYVRQIHLQDNAIDLVRLTDSESCGSGVGFKDNIIGR